MINRINKVVVSLGIIFLLLLLVSSAGCIKLAQKNLDHSAVPQNSGDQPSQSAPEFSQPAPDAPVVTQSTTGVQLVSGVNTVDPVYPEDYYRTVRNLSGKNGEMGARLLRQSVQSQTPLYKFHYSPQFNATAILVNVTKGPLIVYFKATPKQKDPRISFVVVTVRDFNTKSVVAEEQIDQIPKTDTTDQDNSDQGKQIEIFGEGLYHINVYGNQCDVDISIFTGDSQIHQANPVSGLTPVPQSSDEYDLG
jgi:hypothetical protein